MTDARIVLADGTTFEGRAFGADVSVTGEAVFTTGMTGYEEVLTDPSYCGQIVTMTAPQIGNTGINLEDGEARRPALRAFVVRELSEVTSNWRTTESLDAYLKRHGIPGLTGVDTRTLTRHIRDVGAQMAAVGTEDVATLHDRARQAPPMTGQDLTGEVTTKEAYTWTEGSGPWAPAKADATPWHVVAIDFGIKLNILRCLVDEGCRVTVVPATTTADEILALDPDGVFLSNGPGDPAPVTHGIETVRALLGKRPIFGICLGHQLMCLALGGETYKLKFGHRGLNQPVKDLKTGRIEITTQNHGFCVDVNSLEGRCNVTHLHLNDDTCQGIEHVDTGAFSVQYHPEAAAGPHDSRYLFRRFTDAIAQHRA
ncbi:MAG: glutamine-hydrolyzing carbamoyl-phosphate synthase small subunit [Myxococcota bacterium]